MIKSTRKRWCAMFDEKNYVSYMGDKIRKYNISFKIRNLKGGKIDFRISDKDFLIIVCERRLLEMKEGAK